MIIYNSGGAPIIDIEVDDASYRYRGLMRSDELTLAFSLTEHVELPVGAHCTFEDTTYELMSLSNVTVHHRRNYEYRVVMYSPSERTKNYVIYNIVDKRLRFEQSGTPREHLQQIVDNLNAREGSGWSIGACIEAEPQIIAYNYTTCWDGIVQLADTFNTEFEILNKTIYLRKVEYHTSNPLELAYGQGNGLRSGVQRISASAGVGRIYIQGGDRNIGLDNYDAKTLHLPKGVTFNFNGTDFVTSGGVSMTTDANGQSVALTSAPSNATEASLDLSYIYPSREGTVSTVVYEYKKDFYSYSELIAAFPNLTEEDWMNVYVHFCDDSIPASLDYTECMMGDEPLTVIFQNGELIGREFNVTFDKDAKTKEDGGQTTTVIPANRFEIEHTTIDGVDMPNATFRPAVGNKYAIFNCALPQAYINAGSSSKEGAEWDALREAAKYLYDNMDAKVAYRGDLDPLFAKGDWVNIGDYLKCGSYISFSDPAVQSTPVAVRIVGVRQYVNNKECPTIEFSNDVVSPTLMSSMKELQASEARIEEMNKQTQRYAQRSFRNAKETMGMLIDAKLKGYTEAISPIAIQTMQMLVGDESLQFKFWQDALCTIPINPVQPFDMATKTVTVNHAYLQHMTLGINSVTSTHQLSEYKVWELSEHTSATLSDPDKKYYLYAKCDALNDGTNHTTGQYVFSETAIEMEEQVTKNGNGVITGGYYHFLVGILNSEMDGDRDFASLYGFTEILPGQITTDKIRSSDGNSWWDMVTNQMRFGDASRSFSWNLNNSREFRISGGTIVQSSSTDDDAFMITCFRGMYDSDATYAYGDEVNTPDGSTYVYVNKTTPSRGRTPSDDGVYWKLKSSPASSAKLVSIKATSLFFTYEDESVVPSGSNSITLTAETQNIPSGATYVWSYKSGANWYPISGATSTTLTIYDNDSRFSNNALNIKVTVTTGSQSLYDEVSIYRIFGGTDSISAFLTNTTHLFAAGATSAATGSDTFEVVVFRGATRLTPGTDFTITENGISISPSTVTSSMMTVSVGKTGGVQNGTITVSVTTALNIANGTITLPIVIGSTSVSLIYSWALSLTGARGDAGAKLRGPTVWEAGKNYEDGVSTNIQDVVRGSSGKYYICEVAHTSSSSTDPDLNPTQGGHRLWGPFAQMEYLATKVLITPDAIIGELIVDKLFTKKTVSGTEINPIRIQDETIAITDDSGNTAVKITSGNLPTNIPSGGDVTVTTRSTTISAPDGYAEIDTVLGSSSSYRIATLNITAENNKVTIPAMTISATASNGGSYQLYWSIYIGDTMIDDGSGAGNIAARIVTLPQGNNQYLTVRLSGAAFHTSGASTTLTVSFGVQVSGSEINVSYSSSGTIIASDGAQFNYGYGGFKTSSAGAQIIQSGTAYTALASEALNSLTAPKRIVVCTSYPGTMDNDVLYIKVSSS